MNGFKSEGLGRKVEEVVRTYSYVVDGSMRGANDGRGRDSDDEHP